MCLWNNIKVILAYLDPDCLHTSITKHMCNNRSVYMSINTRMNWTKSWCITAQMLTFWLNKTIYVVFFLLFPPKLQHLSMHGCTSVATWSDTLAISPSLIQSHTCPLQASQWTMKSHDSFWNKMHLKVTWERSELTRFLSVSTTQFKC